MFCFKKRSHKKIICILCKKLFYNIQYQTDDKICLKCFDKMMREKQIIL